MLAVDASYVTSHDGVVHEKRQPHSNPYCGTQSVVHGYDGRVIQQRILRDARCMRASQKYLFEESINNGFLAESAETGGNDEPCCCVVTSSNRPRLRSYERDIAPANFDERLSKPGVPAEVAESQLKMRGDTSVIKSFRIVIRFSCQGRHQNESLSSKGRRR